MCFESTDSTFGIITEVDIRGDKLILGLPSAFNQFLVSIAVLVVHDLDVNVVSAACQPFDDEVARRYTVFVAVCFVGSA